MKKQRIIFLRIAWMKHYQGLKKTDLPSGAGSYVEVNEDGGEVCNFLPISGKIYGFARIQGNKSLRIENIGAEFEDDRIENILIIFFAKNPETGGQYIVGWYDNATLYRAVKNLSKNVRQNHYGYNCTTSIKEGHLINVSNRTFEIPKDGPGQTNAWYVERYHDKKFIPSVLEYISNPSDYISRRSRKINFGVPWQKDIEIRKKVEEEAMRVVARYFIDRNFEVTYVHKENYGWDLEAKKDKQTLLLEVKGLSGDFNSVELTSNEYSNSKKNKKIFRLCVVSFALDALKQTLDIFYLDNGRWLSNNNRELFVQEIITARFIVKR